MMSEPNCKECEWHRIGAFSTMDKCYHPSAIVILAKDSILNREVRMTCFDMRQKRNINECGPDGKLFKQKGTI